MKKLLLIILIFSCDSFEESFGVGESEESFSYYDFLAYGWSQIFENNPDLALDYFDQSLSIPDIQYYNSSFVGMGWAKTYQANALLNSDLCVDNSADCTDAVDIARYQAKCFFYQATLTDDLSQLSSTQIIEQCDDEVIALYDGLDIMSFTDDESPDEILDLVATYYEQECAENEQGEAEYINCFQNFILDMQVAYLYLEYLSYLKLIIDDTADDIDEYTYQIIDLFNLFRNSNPDYDIMLYKTGYNFSYALNYKNIASTIVKLYINVGEYEEPCMIANQNELCQNLDCKSGDMIDLIDCIETINLNDF